MENTQIIKFKIHKIKGDFYLEYRDLPGTFMDTSYALL